MVDISIIIVNYRGWRHLENCLLAFETFVDHTFKFEVIVVDNCSNDGVLSQFQQRFGDCRFIENSGNNGFSHGCNLGAACAIGEYLLFLNSDIIATEASIYGMLREIRAKSDLFILSCLQVDRKGNQEQVMRLFPSFLTLNGLSRSVCRMLRGSNRKLSCDILYPDWVSGSVILISCTNFIRLNGWDERYWLYYEDVDLCRRAALLGGRVGVYTRESVFHNHGGSTRSSLKIAALTKSEVIISLHVYLATHYTKLKSVGLHLMVIFDVLFVKLFPALLGVPCFFIKRLSLYRVIYYRMMVYYFNAFKNKTWVSPRSVKFNNNSRFIS